MLKTREIEINKTLKKEETKKENKQKKVANKKKKQIIARNELIVRLQ